MKNKKGFTLTEILVTIVIIGLILIIAIPVVMKISKSAKLRMKSSKEELIIKAAELYAKNNGDVFEDGMAYIQVKDLIYNGYLDSEGTSCGDNLGCVLDPTNNESMNDLQICLQKKNSIVRANFGTCKTYEETSSYEEETSSHVEEASSQQQPPTPIYNSCALEAAYTPENCFTTVNVTSNTVSVTGYTCNYTKIKIPPTINGKSVVEIYGEAWNSNTDASDGAFDGGNLECVEIPDTVTRIGVYAFRNNNLSSISLKNTQEIGSHAFASNNISGNLVIPSSVTEIGEYAFAGNPISTLELNEGLIAIGYRAFASTSLSTVTIPSSVKRIGYQAFFTELFTSVTILGKTTANEFEEWGGKTSNMEVGAYTFSWANDTCYDNIRNVTNGCIHWNG